MTVWSHRWNILATVIMFGLLLVAAVSLSRWALSGATFHGTMADCRAGTGACWAFLGAKARFILFAFYPGDQLWRPGLVVLGLLGLMTVSALPRVWGRGLLLAWLVVLPGAWVLMAGGL
ncbi:MAG TPA: amino acid ABC transporter permease, partial [Paenirhodobacter sp.]